ncbi:hypothetical protein CI610_03650 [invertebrate metagenome]|uniref:Uncharacterized protein n=1 Tax=invertebrate metagenome TaxID=1711999 RepID=A0A2H9T2I9_9ZZZZ
MKVKQIQETLKKLGLDKKTEDDLTTDIIQSQPESIDIATRSPWQHVCLWPLFEYVSLFAAAASVPHLYSCNIPDGCQS